MIARGTVWLAYLDPVVGHGQAGTRPVIVLSEVLFNRGPSGLVIVVPASSRDRGIRSHAVIQPPVGGFTKSSFAMCEQIRSISRDRLKRLIGSLPKSVLNDIEDRVKILLGIV